ncbi:MAG: DNA polymerase III subunit delta [Firmicutes bacterium]|nr:DNA polymerase III subunit delta [Bacillota bacterium]MBQ3112228.1 DNA polymerase III subunit delta [Bacillota bacterium]
MQDLLHSIELGVTMPLYIFCGEEQLLQEQALTRLSDLLSPERNPWQYMLLDGETASAAEVADVAGSAGFFAGKKLVIVRNVPWCSGGRKAASEEDEADKEKDEAALASLLAYAEDPNPDCCLVLVVRGAVDKRRRLVKLFAKNGRVISFDSPKGMERDMWLTNYFRKAGKTADREVLGYISINSGEALSSLQSEADKLILYSGGRSEITMEMATELVSRGSAYNIFELMDAVAGKNAAKALQLYRSMTKAGEAEQKILAMLAGQFRDMLLVAGLRAEGRQPAQIAREQGLHPFRVEKLLRYARAMNSRQLLKALEMLLAADVANKSGEDDLHSRLEQCILRICAF